MSKEFLLDHKNHVNEVIDRVGFGSFQLRAFIIVSLSSFSLGANFSVMTTLPFILSHIWKLEDLEVSLLSSVFISGGLLVCLYMMFFGDRFGRLTMMNISLFLLSLSAILSSLSQEVYSQAFFRLINGISISLSIYSSSVYIIEITPTSIRGAISVGYWFIQCLGEMWIILVIFFFNPNLDQDNWREVSIIAAVPGFLSLIGNYFFLTESPLFQVRKDRKNEAVEILDFIARTNRKDTCSELEKKKIVFMDVCEDQGVSLRYLCSGKLWKKHLMVSILWIFIVFGYYGLYFAFPFLVAVGTDRHDVILVSIMCTGIQVVIELGLIGLIEMSCMGRKNTMILCSAIGAVSSGVAYVSESGFSFFWGTSLAYGSFGGMFSVIFPYTTELYKTNIRTASLALCNSVARIFSVFSPTIFFSIMKVSHLYVFVAVAGLSVGIIVDTLILKTDTKDVILDNSLSQDNTPVNLSYTSG
jgi:putative MFS transporter